MAKFTVVVPAFVSCEVFAANPAEASNRWLQWQAQHGQLAVSPGVTALQVMDRGTPPQVIDRRGRLVGTVSIPYSQTRATPG